MPNPDKAFWAGKRVLLTGHTGFKGSWLALWLNSVGAHVTGVSLPPTTTPSLADLLDIEAICTSHFCDIRDQHNLKKLVTESAPEIVFHLAAQPLVRASYADPLATFGTNVMGSAHLLDALRKVPSAKAVVMVTTDKVYRNLEWEFPYRETDVIGGHDPYSASKAASEIVIDSYRDAFLARRGVAMASARAGNVIGGGDWSEDRLIPDAVRAWQSGAALEVRNPAALRPWQHVLEPLSGYIALAQRLHETPDLAGAYNFGPHASDASSVSRVLELACKAYGKGELIYNNGGDPVHEAGRLQLEVSKSREILGMVPRWALAEAINRTMVWYSAQESGVSAEELCLADIAAFEAGE